MNRSKRYQIALALAALIFSLSPARTAGATNDTAFSRPFWSRPDFFPIAVWLQNPRNAERYKAAGINVYVGLWRGPDEEQLRALKAAGMAVICSQNSFALAHKDDETIVGWMHGDEPDNAQAIRGGKGYGPPIKPEVILEHYKKLRAADPSRTVLLNLGQGVAWDNYIGRGVRRNHPEDYREYIQGCDLVSFDIYPVVHDSPAIRGKLEYVARGVERLVDWSEGQKRVWNCIECTHISEPDRKANGAQIRAEVWMSIISGSRGLIYFVHQFKPSFREAALLDDPGNLAAVTRINAEVQSLARVINTGHPLQPEVSVTSPGPVKFMARELGGTNYFFAVSMTNQPGTASFSSPLLKNTIEVMGESRTILPSAGRFSDPFAAYGVHLYAQKK